MSGDRSSSPTDIIKGLVASQLEALRPMFDGVLKPSGLRMHARFDRRGKLTEITVEPIFKMQGERD